MVRDYRQGDLLHSVGLKMLRDGDWAPVGSYIRWKNTNLQFDLTGAATVAFSGNGLRDMARACEREGVPKRVRRRAGICGWMCLD
jgi:hypothetical protein